MLLDIINTRFKLIMKTKTIVILSALLAFAIFSQGQTTIWEEDFPYADGMTTGSGSPAKWTINSTTADVWSVQASQMQATKIGDEAVWTSQSIDISGYSDVGLFVDVSNGGNMDGGSDYLNVSYILDGGAETFFTVNGENSADFPNQTASQSGLSGNVVTIVVRINNNKSDESHFFDNVIVTGNYTAVTWTGTTSNDWNIGTNWSTGVIPNVASNITIPTSPAGGNFPETNSGSGASCNNLTIETSAHVFVPADNALTVNGTLSNSAGVSGLVLKSDASGTGSLIHNTSSADATVEQYLTGNEWHYVSSPIVGATANVFYDIYLRPFDELASAWGEYIVDETTTLVTMMGYAAWVDGSDETVSFAGPLNNGSKSIQVTNSGGTHAGFNLVGNPFPSTLDWDATSGWSERTNIDNAIYFWEGVGDGGGGNYHYYVGDHNPPEPEPPPIGTATQFIPPNQAFFLIANSTVTLSVDNDARVHSTQSYWKSVSDLKVPIIRLSASNSDGLNDESIIRFFDQATPEHDSRYDAYKLAGYNFPQLYSVTPQETNLAVNTLPEYKESMIIPMGFTAPAVGGYSIDLNEFSNFDNGTTLILEDLQMDIFYNLSENDGYSFNATPDDDPDRFLLHFAGIATSIDAMSHSSVNIYSFESKIYVNLPKDNEPALVTVFNLMGQPVAKKRTFGEEICTLDLVGSSVGFYIVNVQTTNEFKTGKVYIK